MKIFIPVFILSILLTGCQQIYNIAADQQYGNGFSDIPLYYGDFSEIETIDDISSWMRSRVSYRITDTVLSPEEVLDSGYCDCDGYALLYMNISYVRFGVKPSFGLVKQGKKIVHGGEIDHAVVKLHGNYINAQSGSLFTGKVGYEYSFDHVFRYKKSIECLSE